MYTSKKPGRGHYSPCGHQALYPSRRSQHGRFGCFVHQTNTYQGHHQPSEQWSLCQHLAKESLQLCTHGVEFRLPSCGWTPTTSPVLATRLYTMPVCWDLPWPIEVQWHVPQLLEQWNVCRPVHGWRHAVVLGPDAWQQPTYPPKCLATMKNSLRFARPMPVTTTLIAYVQYDNVVVVEAYRTVTFNCCKWCWTCNFRRPLGESPQWLGRWSVSTPGMNTGPWQCSWLPTWSTQLMAGLLGDTGW